MEDKEFTASRLSSNNNLLPNRYKISDFGVTIIDPGVFNDDQESYSFFNIASIKLENPLIGFSKVTLILENDKTVELDGLYNKDAEEIQTLVQTGIMKAKIASRGMSRED
jgi:hypothetical protein